MVGLSRSILELDSPAVHIYIWESDHTGDDERVLGGSLDVIAVTLAIKVGTDLDLQGSNITEPSVYSRKYSDPMGPF